MADINDVILENVLQINGKLGQVSAQVADVREKQGEHDLRLTALEAQTSGLGLTKAQKTALGTALVGLLLEGARHLMAGLSGLFAVIKGVPKL